MIEFQLDRDKSTDNKIRWNALVDGVQFKLYIPKWRVPDPVPNQIYIAIEKPTENDESIALGASASTADRIRAIVRFVSMHTETVRYRPVGDPKDWEIGEPYVPISLLPVPLPKRITVVVQWSKE